MSNCYNGNITTYRFETANNNGVRNLLSHLRKRGGETEARQVLGASEITANLYWIVNICTGKVAWFAVYNSNSLLSVHYSIHYSPCRFRICSGLRVWMRATETSSETRPTLPRTWLANSWKVPEENPLLKKTFYYKFWKISVWIWSGMKRC